MKLKFKIGTNEIKLLSALLKSMTQSFDSKVKMLAYFTDTLILIYPETYLHKTKLSSAKI